MTRNLEFIRKGMKDKLERHLESFLHPSPERLEEVQWAYHEYVDYMWHQLLGRI